MAAVIGHIRSITSTGSFFETAQNETLSQLLAHEEQARINKLEHQLQVAEEEKERLKAENTALLQQQMPAQQQHQQPTEQQYSLLQREKPGADRDVGKKASVESSAGAVASVSGKRTFSQQVCLRIGQAVHLHNWLIACHYDLATVLQK